MLTFHKMITGCVAGDSSAWRAFLAEYTPIVVQISRIYLPGARGEELWKGTLRVMCENDFGALREFERQPEREFLSGLRALHLERSVPAPDSSRTAGSLPEPNAASVAALLQGAPLVHQEVLFLKLAGYSDTTLEKIFRITPAVAKNSLERLNADYGQALEAVGDENLHPSAWLRMLRELWAATTDSCPPLRLLIRIQDGQIGWQEKDPAERHVAECLRCLERWSALKELVYCRREAQPATALLIDGLLAALPVRLEPKKAKSVFAWLFG